MKENENPKLNIFSDKSILENNQPHVTMLYPFFGKNSDIFEDASQLGKYDTYTQTGSHFFEMTSLEKADIAIFPIPWEHVTRDKRNKYKFDLFHDEADDYGIPTVIFYWSDGDELISIKNTIIFRTSFYRSTRKKYEYAMPAWSDDIISRYFNGVIQIREKSPSPSIGFTGYAPEHSVLSVLWHNKIRDKLKLKRANEGKLSSIRSDALQILEKDPSVKKNFIIRKDFWGTIPDMAIRTKQRNEFIQNLIESDYSLCVRGGGNFSYRFYETLCCGRVPLLVDTDCVFPYDFEIDWKKYCIWIDETDLQTIGDRVIEFHNKISPREFSNLQYKCRDVWENYLSPEGFFKNFYKHFVSQ